MNSIIIRNTKVGGWQEFEISEHELLVFRQAMKVLKKCLHMESVFDQVMEEYWEYKNKVDYWRLRSISKPSDYFINYEIRSSLNRLAFNLLNLSKLFLDHHFSSNGKKCFSFELSNCEESKIKVSQQREKIYRENLGYVIGCKLRNKAQHNALPVNGFTFGIEHYLAKNKRVVSFKINYSYEDLLEMGISEKALNPEMCLDLTEILDGYVYGISQMHFLNRELTEQTTSDAKDFIKNMTESKAAATGYSEYWCEVQVEGKESLYAGLEWFDVVSQLKKKHGNPINYSNFEFSNSIKG